MKNALVDRLISTWRGRFGGPSIQRYAGPVCASCGATVDLTRYGHSGTRFCRECRDQAEEFAGKDQLVDIGGGD